jgi:thiol:disulfide interchange protein DsbD
MLWVRKFFGVVLVLMAVYMAQPLLGAKTYQYLMILAALGGGGYLLFGDRSGSARFKLVKSLVTLGLVAAVGLMLWWTQPPAKPEGGHAAWKAYTPQLLAQARKSNAPTLVLFTADWCPPCKKLKAETFNDPAVSQALAKINIILVDLTSNPPRDDRAYATEHGVRGVPTMLIYDTQGKWRQKLTTVGFIAPSELMTRLKSAGYGG